jgi:hypothetical protein
MQRVDPGGLLRARQDHPVGHEVFGVVLALALVE